MSQKAILYIAQSLDGFIADEKGSVDWLIPFQDIPLSKPYDIESFMDSVHAIIMGKITYRQISEELSPNKWMYEGKHTYVFTRSELANKKDISFVNGDIVQFVKKLKQTEQKDIWICGGSNSMNPLLDAGVIDAFYLFTMPVLLGKGTPLFMSEKQQRLKLMEVKKEGDIICSIYQKEVVE